jgi:hypothetical protein
LPFDSAQGDKQKTTADSLPERPNTFSSHNNFSNKKAILKKTAFIKTKKKTYERLYQTISYNNDV